MKRWRCRREKAAAIALRTQQMIAYESGVTRESPIRSAAANTLER